MLCYCKKCGRVVIIDKADDNFCDYCQNIVIPVPKDFLISEEVPLIKTELEDQFINEYIKASPEFDQCLFDHRDEDLYNRRVQNAAKIAHGKAILEEQSKVPKCPTCQSTNVRKISGLESGASIAVFGLFSRKINKNFKCNNCGHTW